MRESYKKMLEKLFTSKNRIKILKYFLFEKEESYIREISKELKISVSAVKREVDNLAFIGIIKIKKNRIIVNKNCSFLGDLKNIFIKTDFIIYPLKEAVDNNKAIKFAFIFGSFARGEYSEESDIDLMVIGDASLSSIIKLIGPTEEEIKKNINPVVWTIENLKKEKNSSFVKDIFKKGIIIIKGDKDELQKIIG